MTRKTKDEDGDEIVERVTQYYHRFVVAMLIAPKLDLTLAIEPVCSEAMRVQCGEAPGCGDEGELTAALRLIDRLHDTYGCFIDAFALDGPRSQRTSIQPPKRSPCHQLYHATIGRAAPIIRRSGYTPSPSRGLRWKARAGARA